MQNLRIVVATIAISLLVGCQRKPEPEAERSVLPTAPPPEPSATGELRGTPTVPTHMKEHFDRSRDLQKALLRGQLNTFKETARWMAEHSWSQTFPIEWKVHVDGLQDAARLGRDAKDLKSAAASFGAMGRACAACHEQLGGPKVMVGTPPTQGAGVARHMARHQWAAVRMWEGLMAPSDDAWVKGAEIMADAPLVPEALAGGKKAAPEVEQLAVSVHAVANRARTTEANERGVVYGELMATCATCHVQLGVSPD